MLNIYRKDCVIRIPFLRLGMVSPEALLTRDNAEAEIHDTLSYLCQDDSDVRPPARPRATVSRGLTVHLAAVAVGTALTQLTMPPIPYMTTTLGNLLRMLAYHRRLAENEPMRPKELELNSKIVAELSVTAKTAFRL